MLFNSLLVVTSCLYAFTSAQAIDPNSVDKATRSKWCLDQKASCPILCDQVRGSGGTSQNTCSSDTLAYSCVCSNGQVPNASEYSQTIPFYECQTNQDNCVANCGGQSACQSSCREDHPCGAQNPTRVNTTSSASAASATATGTKTGGTGGSFTGFGGGSTSTSTANAANTVHDLAVGYGRLYGLVTVFAGVFAGFMLFL